MPEKVNYNPDILSCLANLSSDEVFTPPEIANAMLDMLPQELFQSPDTKFLDPGCKSGVFLREIAKRLEEGLKDKIPNVEQRMEHIMKNQLFAIAITQITGLLSRRSVYCSKDASGRFSVVMFDDNPDGNIGFRRIEHKWDGLGEKNEQKCVFCGAPRKEFDRGDEMETHAYEFIHMNKTTEKELAEMKFDVIIGNPPYHLEDNGNGRSAKPIYQLFVEQAIKLNPRYMSMIIPSRWFSGGKGLDDFRSNMLHDHRIRKLVDYENYKDVFPGLGGLAGGACYFLWDRDNSGLCEVVNMTSQVQSVVIRPLDEFDLFIRQNKALSIVHKVLGWNRTGKTLVNVVSPRKPFGLATNYEPRNKGIPCYFIQKIGRKYANPSDVVDSGEYLNKWKLLAPSTPIAGQTDFSKPVAFYYESNTRIAKPGECCTESYLVLGAFDTEEEVIAFKSYIFTKTVRFLVLQTVVSQHVNRGQYRFVPDLGPYRGEYSDKQLCEMWGISEEEWKLIDSRICNGSNGGADA